MLPLWQTRLEELGLNVAEKDGALRARGSSGPLASWVDLNHFRVVAIDGADAKTFLQGYLTCDMDTLTPAAPLIGAFCNIQGRVVADVVAAEFANRILLWMHASVAEDFLTALRKYLVFSKCKASLLDWCSLGQIDEESAPVPSLTAHAEEGGVRIALPGTAARTVLICPPDSAIEHIQTGGIEDSTRWDMVDIESRWVHVTRATSATFLPQMLGLTALSAVSFTKGCYLGQEVVARAEHRGSVKRQLFVANWQGPAAPAIGETVTDVKEARRAIVVASAGETGSGSALIVTTEEFSGRGSTAAGVTIEVR